MYFLTECNRGTQYHFRPNRTKKCIHRDNEAKPEGHSEKCIR